MLPNKYVILWDDIPVQIKRSFPIAPYPIKTNNPSHIFWFDFKRDAQNFIDTQPVNCNMKIVEVRFEVIHERKPLSNV